MTQPSHRAPPHLDPSSTAFIVVLALATALQAIGTSLTLPALPAIAADFGSSPDAAQLTLSGYLAGLAAGLILLGALSDRFGRRPVLLSGMLLFTAAGIGCTLAQDIGLLIAMRVVQGFAGGAGMIIGRAIVRDVFAREQALQAMSVMVGVMTMMPMVSPFIGGLLLKFVSWRWVFGALALVAAVLTVLTWRLLGESLKHPDRNATNPRRIAANCIEFLRKPECIGFPLIVAGLFGGQFAFIAILPFIAFDSFGLSPSDGSWLLSLNGLSLWLGALFNNRKAGRWPVRKLLRLATGTALAASLVALASTAAVTLGLLHGTLGLILIVVPGFVYSFTFGIAQPNCIVMALQPVPHIAGTASALGSTSQIGAAALLTWLAGYLYNGTPISLGILLAATAVFSFLAFTLVAARYSPARIAPWTTNG